MIDRILAPQYPAHTRRAAACRRTRRLQRVTHRKRPHEAPPACRASIVFCASAGVQRESGNGLPARVEEASLIVAPYVQADRSVFNLVFVARSDGESLDLVCRLSHKAGAVVLKEAGKCRVEIKLANVGLSPIQLMAPAGPGCELSVKIRTEIMQTGIVFARGRKIQTQVRGLKQRLSGSARKTVIVAKRKAHTRSVRK